MFRIWKSTPLNRHPIARRHHARSFWGLALALTIPHVGSGQRANPAPQSPIDQMRDALIVEEVDRDLTGAIAAYQRLIAELDTQRQLAATALFRLGECYRKAGENNKAIAAYERVLRDFSDQTDLGPLAQSALESLGKPATPPMAAGPAPGPAAIAPLNLDWSLISGNIPALERLHASYSQEIELVRQSLERRKVLFDSGRASAESLAEAERELLAVQRQLDLIRSLFESAMDEQSAAVPQAEQEALKTAQRVVRESPDLLKSESENNPLIEPALAGHTSAVEYLIEKGAFPNPWTSITDEQRNATYGVRLLQAVVRNGSLTGAMKLIEALEEDERKADFLGACLVDTITLDYRQLFDLLVAQGANPNFGGLDSLPKPNQSVLVVGGSSWQKYPPNRVTPLYAATSASVPLYYFDRLLELTADPNRYSALSGSGYAVPLHRFLPNGDRVLALLQHGADPNLRNNNERCALHSVADVATARALLEAGADINAQDRMQRTPLVSNMDRDNENAVDVFRFLLDNGANPNVPGYRGRPALFNVIHWDLQADPQASSVKSYAEALFAHPSVDINQSFMIEEEDTLSALQFAAQEGAEHWIEFLLQHGANASLRSSSNKSVLQLLFDDAGQPPSASILETLVATGATLEPLEKGELLLAGVDQAPHLTAALLRIPPLAIPEPRGALASELLRSLGFDPDPENLDALKDLFDFGLDPLQPLSSRSPQNILDLARARIVQATESSDSEQLHRWSALRDLIAENSDKADTDRKSAILIQRGEIRFPFAASTNTEPGDYRLSDLVARVCSPRITLGSKKSESTVPFFPFPALSAIRVHRVDDQGREGILEVPFDEMLRDPEGPRDFYLVPGDIVEIPEAPHRADASWQGFALDIGEALFQLCERKIQFHIGDLSQQVMVHRLIASPVETGVSLHTPYGFVCASSEGARIAATLLQKTIESFETQKRILSTQITDVASRYQENHPSVRRLNASIATYEHLLPRLAWETECMETILQITGASERPDSITPLQSPELSAVHNARIQERSAYVAKLEQLGPEHPDLVAAQNRLRAAELRYQQELAEIGVVLPPWPSTQMAEVSSPLSLGYDSPADLSKLALVAPPGSEFSHAVVRRRIDAENASSIHVEASELHRVRLRDGDDVELHAKRVERLD